MMIMTLRRGRIVLAVVWGIGFIIPMLILAIQTYVGTVYHGKESEAWNWFAPNIVPTIGLIVATFTATAFETAKADKAVAMPFFILTLLLSMLYVIAFISIFLLEPLTNSPPLETLKRSSLFLGIIQGLVTTTLGVFFMKSPKSR
jgi:hypothetical protein